MNRYVSPLRYPGGKATMTPWLGDMLEQQAGSMDIEVWLEPFAGGAGAGLTLLDRDLIGELWLVDANPGIAAFHKTVVDDGEALARRVERTQPTLELFRRSQDVLAAAHDGVHIDNDDLGYAAFIVNRCSHSGIVAPSAGVMSDVTARFTADALAERIRRIHAKAHRIRVTHGDGIAHLEDLDGTCGVEEELVAFVDPPYIREGNRLYANGMTQAAHQRLANALNASPVRWMLTYDDEPAVSDELYPERRVLAYEIRNTTAGHRVAREFAIFSDNLDVRGLPIAPLARLGAEYVRDAA